jgi:hypothetical protein
MKKLLFLGLIFVFCGCDNRTWHEDEETKDEPVDVLIINNVKFNVYEDQYGNQYIQEQTYGPFYIYIPYKPIEEEEDLK